MRAVHCPPLAATLLALLLPLLLAHPLAALADEWNDSFAEPSPYKLLRGVAVRNGPGNNTERLGAVSAGDVIHVSEIIKGWHRFEFHGKQGWIFKRYLRPMAAGEPGSESPPPQSAAQPPETSPPASQEDVVAQALDELEQQAGEQTPPAQEPPTEEPATEAPPTEEPLVAEPGTAFEEPAAPPMEEPLQPSAEEPAPVVAEPLNESAEEDPPAPVQQEEDDGELAALERPAKEEPERKRVARTPAEPVSAEDCPRFTSLRITPDSKEATFEADIAPGAKACFRVLALEGWTLEVTLRSNSDEARFDVFTPQEGRLASSMSAWAHPVSTSGDKQLVIHTTGAPTRFTLNVLVRQQ